MNVFIALKGTHFWILFNDMDFDDKLDRMNCFNDLNLLVFHFQNSSVCNTLQVQSESAFKVTNAFSIPSLS